LTDEKPARKHFEHDNEACARDSRQDFAKALESTKLPESLKYVQLDFLTNIRQNMNEERGRTPNFLNRPVLHKLFQEIGTARHGGELLEYWNVEEHGDVLLDPDLFEYSLAAFLRYDGVYPRMSLMKD
jgi:hypothetical protein